MASFNVHIKRYTNTNYKSLLRRKSGQTFTHYREGNFFRPIWRGRKKTIAMGGRTGSQHCSTVLCDLIITLSVFIEGRKGGERAKTKCDSIQGSGEQLHTLKGKPVNNLRIYPTFSPPMSSTHFRDLTNCLVIA